MRQCPLLTSLPQAEAEQRAKAAAAAEAAAAATREELASERQAVAVARRRLDEQLRQAQRPGSWVQKRSPALF